MKLLDLVKLSEKEGFQLMGSEDEELEKGENPYYKKLREIGFYRVYETYYKDEYSCLQFYCTGFTNSEIGYRWLLSAVDEDDENLETALYDLYIVTKGNNSWERKDKKVFTGTLKQILEYSKNKDKSGYKIAARQNEKDEVLEKMLKDIQEQCKGFTLRETEIPKK